ncbi:hypothetical protein BDK51DRAFT_48980 [Blyttiomyces helicus]|uniref:Uncharacterized protein n=1 Tax=Blyttiomyces helicus TaxID=388810 RepID=A0A4P9WIV7_9FUNG|nr:hypothetical protein BDK51DRAFT_48980 [Blyttiomyces helicus]|eukprot:RKO91388.1 hypothetical protein BDK51DRAFT_48980 [Blyttiomyces helicus]
MIHNVGKASSHVMCLSGVKDIILVTASILIYSTTMTCLHIFGYAVSLGGLRYTTATGFTELFASDRCGRRNARAARITEHLACARCGRGQLGRKRVRSFLPPVVVGDSEGGKGGKDIEDGTSRKDFEDSKDLPCIEFEIVICLFTSANSSNPLEIGVPDVSGGDRIGDWDRRLSPAYQTSDAREAAPTFVTWSIDTTR